MKTYHKDENGNILMHSDVYLGEDYISDDLYHWKYLKKVKSPSGKWRYIYDDSEMRKQERLHKTIEKKINSKSGYRFIGKDGYNHTIKGNSHYRFRIGGSSEMRTAKDEMREKQYESYKKYKYQKLKDFPKRTIARGIGFINKLLLNIEKLFR